MIHRYAFYIEKLKADLKKLSTLAKVEASQRYFPAGINCIGVSAGDITLVIKEFHLNTDLNPQDVLAITEQLLAQAEYSEEVLLAFGLINKYVKKHYSDALLHRFTFWLENYASNWSHVDDLCIKTVYQFLLARPHLIEQTQSWIHSEVSWCRRASNVVWVKFIKRKIGQSTYCLNPDLVFENCGALLQDPDDFVQKSIGWLLKVTSVHHEKAVIDYLLKNQQFMPRSTIRYAIEKMDAETRKNLLIQTR